MKIAIFSPSLKSGGAEQVVVNLARGFLRANHAVHLVLADARGELLSELPTGITIINLGKKRLINCVIPLIRYVRINKPDIFLSSQTHANVITSLAFHFFSNSTKLILSEHTSISIHLTPVYRNKGRYIVQLAKMFFPRADAIVAVSNGAAKNISQIINIAEDQLNVIYNPVQLSEIEEKSSEMVSHPWLLSDGVPVILAVGRLTSAKDYPTLLRAFQLLVQKRDARLIILGEGEDRDELEKLVIDLNLFEKVSMPGYADNPYAYMSKSSLFVLSSAWEGFAVVIVEALSCGSTVVATNCPSGPAEILDDGRFGSLVPVGDAETLADAIDVALDNRRDPVSQQTRAQEFAENKAVKKYLSLFYSLTGKKDFDESVL